jgi:hypothetical protein
MRRKIRLINIAEKPRTNVKVGAPKPQIIILPAIGILPLR